MYEASSIYKREMGGSLCSGEFAGRLPPRHIIRIALRLLRTPDYEILQLRRYYSKSSDKRRMALTTESCYLRWHWQNYQAKVLRLLLIDRR